MPSIHYELSQLFAAWSAASKPSSPVVMSAMTMTIPAIVDNGLMKVAQGLKEAGSLLWTADSGGGATS